MAVQLSRRAFTVHEYYLMAKAGILTEDDRVELLDGEVIQMTPIGSRHADCVNRLARLCIERLGDRCVVSIQNPVRLSEYSEPQPDVALLRADRSYAAAHPGPQDVLLLIEVADTSVETDRQVKVPMYARAGIPETWVIDLTANQVEVSRQPTSEGYRTTERVGRHGSLVPQAFPDLVLSVDDLL